MVNDSRGFYTSRVIGTVLNEAMRMLVEGVDPAVIESAGRQAGYPAPQLQLQDELNLKLARKIGSENAAAAEAAGVTIDDGGVNALVDLFLDDLAAPASWRARASEYDETASAPAWSGLRGESRS